MKQIKNSNIRKTSFEDAFFVRMKIQNSIPLPKYPHKTPKAQQNRTASHYSQTLFYLLNTKLEPFVERVKKSENNLSKNQVNEWIAQRQTQFKQIIERQNRNGSLFIKVPSSDDKIFLRTPQQVFKLNQMIKQKRLNLCNNQPQKESEEISFKKRNSMSRTESHRKPNQKITVFPVLLKLKQQNKTMRTLNDFDSSIAKDQKMNASNHTIRTKIALFQKNHQSMLSFQHSVQNIQTLKQTQQKQEEEQAELKRSKSFLERKTSISQSIRSFRSPLYEHKAKAPEPLKKYVGRQRSPTVGKKLGNKYLELQNRLENLLKEVRGSKKPNSH